MIARRESRNKNVLPTTRKSQKLFPLRAFLLPHKKVFGPRGTTNERRRQKNGHLRHTTKFRSLGTYGRYTFEAPTGNRRPSFSNGMAQRGDWSDAFLAGRTSVPNHRPRLLFPCLIIMDRREGAINGSHQPLDDDTALPSLCARRKKA
jgi:hypothetical protein